MESGQEKVIKLRDTPATRRALNHINVGDAPVPQDRGNVNLAEDSLPGSELGGDDADGEGGETNDETADAMSDRTAETHDDARDDGVPGPEPAAASFPAVNGLDHLRSAGTEVLAALTPFARSKDGRSICDCIASIADSLAIIAKRSEGRGDTMPYQAVMNPTPVPPPAPPAQAMMVGGGRPRGRGERSHRHSRARDRDRYRYRESRRREVRRGGNDWCAPASETPSPSQEGGSSGGVSTRSDDASPAPRSGSSRSTSSHSSRSSGGGGGLRIGGNSASESDSARDDDDGGDDDDNDNDNHDASDSGSDGSGSA